MTFTARVKDEITNNQLNEIENRNLFLGYLFSNGTFFENKVSLSLENKTTAEKLFKTLKYCYHKEAKITIRTQKKFRVQRFFILTIDDEINFFRDELYNLPLDDRECVESFIKGVFLASGSINDPKKSRYHLEMSFGDEKKSQYVLNILRGLNYNFKQIKRDKNFMLYLKSSEEISDFLKILGTVNSLFYFEDIRIYRDHANMVNRLNNCEQANYEKSLATSEKQIEMFSYLKENDYLSLMDEKTRQVLEYRLRYSEESYQSLADILSQELDRKVTKSYINHHLRKAVEIYDRIVGSDN